MRLIDMHCDTIFMLMRMENENLRSSSLCVDIEKMKTAGSMAQFFACFIYVDELVEENKWEAGYQVALQMISRGKKEFERYSEHLSLAENFDDMMDLYAKGKVAGFLTIEEGGILNGKISRLEELYTHGIRLVTLTWNRENCIGFPNSKDPAIMQKGLKPFGMEVIHRMNELGMIIDVSHLSDGGFWDVIQNSTKPVVASHSNARTLCSHPRNLSDEMIRALATKGGTTGLNLYPYFLRESGHTTIDDMVQHIWHIYCVGGEDVVAVGTDFDGFDEGESEILHIGQMELIYRALAKKGFTERQLEKFWHGNAMRVIKEVTM